MCGGHRDSPAQLLTVVRSVLKTIWDPSTAIALILTDSSWHRHRSRLEGRGHSFLVGAAGVDDCFESLLGERLELLHDPAEAFQLLAQEWPLRLCFDVRYHFHGFVCGLFSDALVGK